MGKQSVYSIFNYTDFSFALDNESNIDEQIANQI